MTCPCDPRSHLREVAVYPTADTVTIWMVACDECEDGKALSRARLVDDTARVTVKGVVGRIPRQVQTLSGFRAVLDRERQQGSPARWRIDPCDLDRVPLSQRASRAAVVVPELVRAVPA